MDYLMLTQPQYKQDATASWAPGTSLIYLVAFCDAAYLALAAQMLRTLYHFGGYCGDVLFITEEALKASILAMPELVHFKVHFLILGPCFRGPKEEQRLVAAVARMRVFEFDGIQRFNTLLYLDTDILVLNKIQPLLDGLSGGQYMSAMPEMTICSPYHGGHLLFWYLANTEPVRMSDPIKGYEYYMDRMSILSDVGCQQKSFNTGVLLVPNSAWMRDFFNATVAHVNEWMRLGFRLPKAMEQPFITFQGHRYRAVQFYPVRNMTQVLYLSDSQFATRTPDPAAVLVHFPMRGGQKKQLMRAFMQRNRIVLQADKHHGATCTSQPERAK
uniref:Nucleotide-diphospho-sugar transferase domain-containing protein n=1 Tax=Eutreptiella gymnastica TaxID=73025 RepID=A0A7S4CMT9_9EUGL